MVGFIFGLAKISPGNQKEISEKLMKMSVAGTFYPKEKEILETKLDGLLNAAEKKTLTDPIRVLVAPHAGLDYSGGVAGAGFKQIAGANINKVFILASSHYHAFKHLAVVTSGQWETPLGNVEIDGQTAKNIISPDGQIKEDPKLFDKEHPIEIQVVWIKKALPEAKIVPILIGQTTPEALTALAYRIAQNMDEKTLLVVSTDLSHYPDYETAQEIDSQTIQKIISGDLTGLGQKTPEVETTACGADALRVAQKVSDLMDWEKPILIQYQNSGDMTADKSRVVGYAALVTTGINTILSIPELSGPTRIEALDIAKKTLTEFVTGKKTIQTGEVQNPILNEPLGAFVTLKKDGQLRGCIGEFEPTKPLFQVIQEKTIAAASTDPRFKPVTASELSDIAIEISVMTPRQKISDWQQIKLGTDGVVLVMGDKMGTFLPQVATENKWGLEEFLSQLCSQKVGLPADCYLDPTTQLYTFQAQVF
jgi:hypothetical protein